MAGPCPLVYPCPAWVSGHAYLGPLQGPILWQTSNVPCILEGLAPGYFTVVFVVVCFEHQLASSQIWSVLCLQAPDKGHCVSFKRKVLQRHFQFNFWILCMRRANSILGHHWSTWTIMELVCRRMGAGRYGGEKNPKQPYACLILYNNQQGIFNVCYVKKNFKCVSWGILCH